MPMNELSTNLMNAFLYELINLVIHILNACKLFRYNLKAQDNEIICILYSFSKFYEFLSAKQNMNKMLCFFKNSLRIAIIFCVKYPK